MEDISGYRNEEKIMIIFTVFSIDTGIYVGSITDIYIYTYIYILELYYIKELQSLENENSVE